MRLSPTKHFIKFLTLLASSVLLLSISLRAFSAEDYTNLSLKQAIEIALSNNIERKISYQSAAIAESQYKEALSARWPSLTLQGSFQRRDEAPMFVFPSANIPVPMLGPSAGIVVPEQNIKLFNRDTTVTSLQMMYPLYTGGKISSLISQAEIGKEIAQQEMRRTSLQVIRDVKRYYYAAQLTQSLNETANNTVSLLTTTRDLTKSIYEAGSESINKLDYLKTDLAVSYTKSIAADFSAKHKSAITALTNAMGLPWNSQITPTDRLNTKQINSPEIDALVRQANEFNPQVGILKLAVKAANAKIDEAQSGHLPQVGITADASHIQNSYNAGLSNDANRNNWTIGIGVSLPLFNGWRTTSQVSTDKLQQQQMLEKQKLVEQGIAALIKNLFIEFDSAREQVAISEQASHTAEENMDLTSRAFQIGVSKPQDVIEAHILYAVIKANLLRAQHDQMLKLAEIDYVLGYEAE